MDKRDYFVAASKADAWRHRVWIFTAFTVTDLKSQPHPDDHWDYRLFELDGGYAFFNPLTKLLEPIEGTTVTQPLFDFKERFVIKAGEIPNVTKDTLTT